LGRLDVETFMYNVALINAPFASLKLPSLALTQLKHVVDRALGDRVGTEVLYLNHDFARYAGADLYQSIAVDMEAPYNGFGDWFFRQSAFPELPDNTDVYFQRYFPRRTSKTEALKRTVRDKRGELDSVLDALVDRYALADRDLVGFTSMFSQNVACFALARRIKARNPGVVIVMGGANCESPMGQEIVRNVAAVDFVFSGNALKSFPEFVRLTAGGDLKARHRIQGVFSKTNCLLGMGPGPIGEELPLDVPIPLDYDSFMESLESKFPAAGIEPILLFETSRGCWWGERAHCTFCGLNGVSMNYRSMPSELARDLIRSLFKYTSKVSRLQSVDNILPKHYPKEVFADLGTPSHVTIFYEVKADLSDEDMRLLADAGVREVQPGIESLATSTLKLMKKGTSVFQNLRFLKMCLALDIFPCWSLLVGFPGEGADVYKKYLADIPKVVHLPPPSGVYPVRPDRYSPYQVRAKEFGMDLHPADFYELVYPFKKESIAELAYFFRDHNFEAEYFTVMVEWFDQVREKVDAWCARWNRDVFQHPPLLYLDEMASGAALVRDSRAGTMLEHELSPAGLALLRHLMKPRSRTDLASELARDCDVSLELARLEELGLLFSEGDRLMSLVMAERPVQIAAAAGWSWAGEGLAASGSKMT
jgi:ribosomal peptide maturation radical SAM protein 1